MTRHSGPTFLFLMTAAGLTAACGSDQPDPSDHVTAKGAALHRAQSCDDLLWQIQNDAIAKLDAQVEAYKAGDYYGGGRLSFAEDGLAPDGAGAPGAAAGTGGSTSAGGDDSAKRSPDSHSETNTQVQGVDEADIVKTDGERIYLIHGSELFLVDSWPATDMAVLGSAPIEGQPTEMFVDGERAVVFSTAWPQNLPGMEGDAKRSTPEYDCYDCYYGGGPTFTKISIFDVAGDTPKLLDETLVEGSYVSSRRHGDVVRSVVQGGFRAPGLYYPDVEPYDSFGREKSEQRLAADLDAWRDGVAADIENTELSDWIPRRYAKAEAGWEPLDPGCSDYFVPQPGLTESGVTQVVAFSIDEPAPSVVAVLGGAQHVYSNHDSLVLAQTDWRWDMFQAEETRTVLHRFAIAADATAYRASGFAPGYLHNQFSIDEKDGILRLSTTQERRLESDNPWMTEPSNYVLTMQADGTELVVIDQTEPMAPGETIFSTRFMGDRAYVVTFRQTDPLFVVDISDPTALEVLGELHIPGFSDYMHPLSEDHLLTIGMDGDDAGNIFGVALQIFDVSDDTDPQLVHKHVFDDYGYSEANHNHKAFTFVDDYFAEDLGLLMFPLVTYGQQYRSALEVLQVSSKSGFSHVGSVDHTQLINAGCSEYELYGEPCYYYYGEEMRRGLQIDDYVYAVSQGGVTAHVLGDGAQLGEAVATIELPAPQHYDPYGGEWGTGGGVEVGPAPMGGSSGF